MNDLIAQSQGLARVLNHFSKSLEERMAEFPTLTIEEQRLAVSLNAWDGHDFNPDRVEQMWAMISLGNVAMAHHPREILVPYIQSRFWVFVLEDHDDYPESMSELLKGLAHDWPVQKSPDQLFWLVPKDIETDFSFVERLFKEDLDVAREALQMAYGTPELDVSEESFQHHKNMRIDVGLPDYFEAVGITKPVSISEALKILRRRDVKMSSSEKKQGEALVLQSQIPGVEATELSALVCTLLSAKKLVNQPPADWRVYLEHLKLLVDRGAEIVALEKNISRAQVFRTYFLQSVYYVGFCSVEYPQRMMKEINRLLWVPGIWIEELRGLDLNHPSSFVKVEDVLGRVADLKKLLGTSTAEDPVQAMVFARTRLAETVLGGPLDLKWNGKQLPPEVLNKLGAHVRSEKFWREELEQEIREPFFQIKKK